MKLLLGLITGLIFGYLMQRARVIRYDKQLGALRFQDMTIVKFMLSTVMVGMVGVYLLHDLGMVKLSIKSFDAAAVILGGLIFGLGWGLVGYCPGTASGALGEGRLDAAWGMLGMLVGAGLYAEAYPALSASVLKWGQMGKITLPQVLGLNHWLVIGLFILAGALLFWWFEKKGL